MQSPEQVIILDISLGNTMHFGFSWLYVLQIGLQSFIDALEPAIEAQRLLSAVLPKTRCRDKMS